MLSPYVTKKDLYSSFDTPSFTFPFIWGFVEANCTTLEFFVDKNTSCCVDNEFVLEGIAGELEGIAGELEGNAFELEGIAGELEGNTFILEGNTFILEFVFNGELDDDDEILITEVLFSRFSISII